MENFRAGFCLPALVLFAPLLLAPATTKPLAVVDTAISDTDGGSPLPPSYAHVPGETLFFSFRVEGFQASTADKIHLTYKVEALDPRGVRLAEPVTGEVEDTLAPQDKNWKPLVHQEIVIPPLADSGIYKIVVSVSDIVGQTTASKEVPVEVRGHHVDPSDTLVIRNFHFYREEQSNEPLRQAVYRPGNTLWARFDVIGYKYGPNNALDVSYDVAITASSGKVLWSQADAAMDQSQSFYPKRYVPGSMSLNLDRNVHPGQYTMVITAHDKIGNQTSESRESFTVE
jgi:hypothetical protein